MFAFSPLKWPDGFHCLLESRYSERTNFNENTQLKKVINCRTQELLCWFTTVIYLAWDLVFNRDLKLLRKGKGFFPWISTLYKKPYF